VQPKKYVFHPLHPYPTPHPTIPKKLAAQDSIYERFPAFLAASSIHVNVFSLQLSPNGALQRPKCSLLALIRTSILPSRSQPTHHQIPEPSLQHCGDAQRQATSPLTTTSPSLPLHFSAPAPLQCLPSLAFTSDHPQFQVVLASSRTITVCQGLCPRRPCACTIWHPLPNCLLFNSCFDARTDFFLDACRSQVTSFSMTMTAIHVWAHAPSVRAQ
jgi:hypothetical protein